MESQKMNNKIKNISSTSSTAKGWDNKKIGTFVAIGISAALVSIILPEIAMAGSKFDIDAGVKAATDPIIKGINDHWGKAVVITGTAGAVVGEGDARQRATRAAFAATAAGAVVLALLAMLT